MKKTKLEKGITLVALIITIVVLLILAVVSIGAVRDSGIIGHATNTKSESTVAEEGEIVALAVNEWQLQKNTPNNVEDFKTAIETALKNEKESGKVKEISENEDGSLTIIFNKTDNKYKITAEGEISRVTEDLPNEPDDEPQKEPDDDEKLTYADFWEAARKLYEDNKDEYGDMYLAISDKLIIVMGYDDYSTEMSEFLFYMENSENEETIEFIMRGNNVDTGNVNGGEINKWYRALNASEFDFEDDLGLPDEVKNFKSGTAYEGYEELCELFDEAVEEHEKKLSN